MAHLFLIKKYEYKRKFKTGNTVIYKYMYNYKRIEIYSIITIPTSVNFTYTIARRLGYFIVDMTFIN